MLLFTNLNVPSNPLIGDILSRHRADIALTPHLPHCVISSTFPLTHLLTHRRSLKANCPVDSVKRPTRTLVNTLVCGFNAFLEQRIKEVSLDWGWCCHEAPLANFSNTTIRHSWRWTTGRDRNCKGWGRFLSLTLPSNPWAPVLFYLFFGSDRSHTTVSFYSIILQYHSLG